MKLFSNPGGKVYRSHRVECGITVQSIANTKGAKGKGRKKT